MAYGLSTRFHSRGPHLAILAVGRRAVYIRRMRLIVVAALLVPLLLAIAGCGGDNLSLCDGCSTPTPIATPTLTPAPTQTPSVPIPTGT
jgi:hypothetical protein